MAIYSGELQLLRLEEYFQNSCLSLPEVLTHLCGNYEAIDCGAVLLHCIML